MALKTRKCCVIGDPIAHSMSPAIWSAAFKELGMNDCAYTPMQVKKDELKKKMNEFRSADFVGVNVTVPHKVEVLKFLDEVDALAKKIGAVNTVKNEGGKLKGFNTDGFGALEALKQNGVQLNGKNVLLLGAGGAARAITFTLLQEEKIKLSILNDDERAFQLQKELNGFFDAGVQAGLLNEANLKLFVSRADILINATPVGMHPNEGKSIVPKKLLRKKLVVFDIVYNPLETLLLKDAREVGCKTVSGELMLVYQAVKAFELFFGKTPPAKKMHAVVLMELKKK
ncbi:shikimate dehydrogenase [Candidatus Micrarchaeota archaeon]|nr:shikimate dehydrogenase [Candidatus Micrarchaeota archaeon]